jgi:glycosyltransferase involved in cell wall biosynthesis
MPGYVDDVAAALHAADLFVLSSDYEGLPAVVLEAMAANCPVLGTDCFPAARALLGSTDGCGIIGRTDPEGLSALIETFLTRSRPTHLRAIAERYSIANGIASHAEAVRSTF